MNLTEASLCKIEAALAAAEAENARLAAERDTALATMHTLQDHRNDFAQRLQQIARHCMSLPDNSGEINSTNAGFIIETINTIFDLTQNGGGE